MPPLEVTTSVATLVLPAAYTSRELVLPQVGERDTAGVIGELCRVMRRQGGAGDMLPFYHAVLNQELLDSTVLDKGVAVPHARTAAVGRLRFAYTGACRNR